ncbi:hypothetical protein [Neobacillus niacini]|nr:hypothetical protein [Neobacillus niacini]MDR7001067.1 hypothetical protein [Neobacillus niacini]
MFSHDHNGNMLEDVLAAGKHQAKRTVTVAEWVKKANQWNFTKSALS